MLLFQLGLTLRLFYHKPSPNTLDVALVNALKLYLYLMIVTIFFFGTPLALMLQEENFVNVANFLGLEIIPNIKTFKWTAIVFVVGCLLLFFFLTLISE
jgi:hypothetical protein